MVPVREEAVFRAQKLYEGVFSGAEEYWDTDASSSAHDRVAGLKMVALVLLTRPSFFKSASKTRYLAAYTLENEAELGDLAFNGPTWKTVLADFNPCDVKHAS